MTDEFYATSIQPLMYNYIKEQKCFQRNTAIALGNQSNLANWRLINELFRTY